MFRRFSINFALFSMGIDAVIIIVSLRMANQLRPFLNFLPFTNDVRKPMELPSLLNPIFIIVWIGIFLIMAVYDGRRNLRVTDEMASVSLGSIIAGVSLAGILYLTYRDVSRILFLAFVILAFLSLITWRLIARLIFRMNSQRLRTQRRVLIVGAGKIGQDLSTKIQENAFMGNYFVGFLDDNEEKIHNDSRILGTLKDAHLLIERHRIDDVVIALPLRAHDRMNQLVAELHDLPVKVLVVPDYYHLALHRAAVEDFAGIPMLDLRAPAITDYQRMLKRGFDLVITLFLLPMSLVIMAIIAIAIKLEGSGSVLFQQKRVGENGRLFDMFKFRTMVTDAENLRHLVEKYDPDGQLIHKSNQDPRVTGVGRFLRKTSLDELPQLLNILRGEMSLVGPRPEIPYLVERYEPWQRKRFAVPQGITGWWQVNGRSDKPMHLHTEDDLYYVQNYSLLLDIKIILKTIGVVIRGRGAF